jgi:transcriptional regulator with XRE-family HTH domain
MIGIRIRELRRQRGWSQEQLGAMIGFSQSKISKIENGYCDSLSDLKLIAKALDVKLEDLVREDGPDEKKNNELTVDDHNG